MSIDVDESTEVPVDLPSKAVVPFTYGDSQLIEKLFALLTVHGISPEKAQEIKDTLVTTLQSQIKHTTLSDIHKLSTKCVACPDMNHDASLPKWNRESPSVLFILESPDCLSTDGRKLFIDSLVRNKFQTSWCATTYLTRCTKSGDVDGEEIARCSTSYLFNEIQMMRPRVIVPMGATATKIFLGLDIKLTELVAQPTPIWLGPWCLVPCMSPNYAANPNVRQSKAFNLILKKVHALAAVKEEP
jgi:uracil-DNA glycosylase